MHIKPFVHGIMRELKYRMTVKMRKSLFNKKNISPSCSYCTNGRLAPDGENVLCIKCGVVEKDYSCKKFSYDPLKRQPKRPCQPEKFDPEDFAL